MMEGIMDNMQRKLENFPTNIKSSNEDCTQCPHLIKNKYEIKMDALTWGYLQSLMYKMQNYEFSAYLLGTLSDDGTHFVIDDYYIPSQRVWGAKAIIDEEIYTIPKEIRERIIGHLHSHHRLGSFHSGTDIEYMNHPLNIVIADQGEYIASIRVKSECNKWMRIEKIPITFFGTYADEDELEKITKEVYQQPINSFNSLREQPTTVKECSWCAQEILFGQMIHNYMGEDYCSEECVEEYKACLEKEISKEDSNEGNLGIPIIDDDVEIIEENSVRDGMIL